MAITLSFLIDALSTAGYVIYTGASFSADSISNIECSSQESKKLKSDCTEIVEDLQQIDMKLLITGRCHHLIQTITKCLEWAYKYDKKCRLKKFLFSNTYKDNFTSCYLELAKYYYSIVFSVFLTHYFPNIQTQLNDSINLRIANKDNTNENNENNENN